MSSEENKSISEKIEQTNILKQKLNSGLKLFKEEFPENPQMLKTNQINKQKNETTTNNDSTNILDKDKDKEQNPLNKNQSSSNDLNSSSNENNKCTYFQSKKINLFEKRENVDKPCCCCTKTKCIKKYCECFANNRYCKDCHCIDCKNKLIYLNNNNIKDIPENEIIFCTCSKSNCNKKYCECYKYGKKCNDKCRCVNCLNNISPKFNINNSENNDNISENNEKSNFKNIENNNNDIVKKDNIKDNNLNNLENNKAKINLDEEKSNSRKSSISDDSNDTYKIQRISVFISQYQTLVNVERFTKEDMMLISKKRYCTK